MLPESFSTEDNFYDVTGDGVIIKNFYSDKNIEVTYRKSDDKKRKLCVTHKSISSWNQLDSLKSIMKDIFLPKGYPHSVSNDYLEYQFWDTCQAFCSSISGILSMSAVMEGVGVGSEAASPVSAAIMWIMKDGTGMLGSIVFAWSKGSKLDADCKKWRLFADFLNDVAMCLELYIPHAMKYSMLILCISTTMKALVGVAGSATRAALTSHQAIQGNMADVAAKDGSQEIFINLCAYICGILLLKSITEIDKIWTVMSMFVLLHLLFNYKAVTCLKINVYNGERYRLSLRSFLATSNVPTVVQVNRNESVFFGKGNYDIDVFGFNIRLGVSLEQAIVQQKLTPDDLIFLVSSFQSKNYIIIPYVKRREILVSFRLNINDTDLMKAYFHAVLIALAVEILSPKKGLPIVKRKRHNSPLSRLSKVLKDYSFTKEIGTYRSKSLPVSVLFGCEDVVDREFSFFCKLSLEQGWKIDKHLILFDDWKTDWKYVEDKILIIPPNIRGSAGGISTTPSSKKKTSEQAQARRTTIQYVPQPNTSPKKSKQFVNYSGVNF